MKKLFLLILLMISASCAGQRIQPLEPVIIEVPLTVKYINAEEMGLFSKEVGILYKVNPVEVELEKTYWFWIDLAPCNNCKSRTGSVLDFSITPEQAARDIAAKTLRLKNIK